MPGSLPAISFKPPLPLFLPSLFVCLERETLRVSSLARFLPRIHPSFLSCGRWQRVLSARRICIEITRERFPACCLPPLHGVRLPPPIILFLFSTLPPPLSLSLSVSISLHTHLRVIRQLPSPQPWYLSLLYIVRTRSVVLDRPLEKNSDRSASRWIPITRNSSFHRCRDYPLLRKSELYRDFHFLPALSRSSAIQRRLDNDVKHVPRVGFGAAESLGHRLNRRSR